MNTLLIRILFFILLSTCNTFTQAIDTSQAINNNELFKDKKILIIGGTGYLGRAIAKEVLKYNPQKIVIFSKDEVKHFNVLRAFNYDPKIKSVIGDIRDYGQLLMVTRDIDVVFHTAALKRMDSLEDNVDQAIKTNVVGSLNVFNACNTNNVGKVLFISTDKACCSVNAYGASKFIIEKLFTNYDRKNTKTKFYAVRFGNILDSTGSVIPIFSEKIKRGEDLTLTDPRMTRFIVNKDDAIELIFDVLRYGIGGEIFVRKLPSLKVTDLINVLKTKYNASNNVKTIGLRPGEKIHEELINLTEIPRTYDFGNYYVITPTINNWLMTNEQEPTYMQKGQRLNETIMTSFSSDKAIIGQKELAEILDKSGL
jgi:FlaA1/EpsC-like NDP-sugar epimerase